MKIKEVLDKPDDNPRHCWTVLVEYSNGATQTVYWDNAEYHRQLFTEKLEKVAPELVTELDDLLILIREQTLIDEYTD